VDLFISSTDTTSGVSATSNKNGNCVLTVDSENSLHSVEIQLHQYPTVLKALLAAYQIGRESATTELQITQAV
jgi:hypothetical protein